MNAPETAVAPPAPPAALAEEADLVEDDLLVEEISIDGMCGVY
jgi:mycofactocin precursor